MAQLPPSPPPPPSTADADARDLLRQIVTAFEREEQAALGALRAARAAAKARITGSCRVFVCTVGSIGYLADYAESHTVTTAVVDEASKLPEWQVPALLAASPALANLVLVGDHKQLGPFTSVQDGPAAQQARPGDWLCPDCGRHNFSRNMRCFVRFCKVPAAVGGGHSAFSCGTCHSERKITPSPPRLLQGRQAGVPHRSAAAISHRQPALAYGRALPPPRPGAPSPCTRLVP